MPLDLKNLGEVALWRYDKRNGLPQFDSDKVEDDDVAYTALPLSTFAALVAELRALRDIAGQIVPPDDDGEWDDEYVMVPIHLVERLRTALPREATPVAWEVTRADGTGNGVETSLASAEYRVTNLNARTEPNIVRHQPYRVIPLFRAPGGAS